MSATRTGTVVKGTYGRALTRAMRAAGVGDTILGRACGASKDMVRTWRTGAGIPPVRIGELIYEALGCDVRLRSALTRERRRVCPECDQVFYVDSETGRATKSRFCTDRCASNNLTRANRAHKREYSLSVTRRRRFMLEEDLARHKAAVVAMCEACADGACPNGQCELRPVSPFPLIQLQRRSA